MERKVKFEILADEYFALGKKMRSAALSWLKARLKKIPIIDFSCMDYRISCNYNGGNHPEYASDCFSTIEGVSLECGNVYLQIEDCPKYDIDELSNDEVYELCDYIKNVYLPNRDEEYENYQSSEFSKEI